MPVEYHDCLFALFSLQARARFTLPCWKESHTILLHKRGDATLLANWRPIGLLNAAGKLWTLMLEDALLRFCETAGLLSDSQSGFRPDRSCLQQNLYVTSVIEDAQHFKRNLYITYIDFANAFGSVGHAQLAHILQAVGLPQDAIDIIRELYAGASTRLSVPAGLTEPVPITRGTVQGDPLSPLLFLLFLEPLVQWLEADADTDGYQPGCFAHPANLGPGARAAECWRPAHSAAAASGEYADDAALLSRSIEGSGRMLRKVDLFCEWAQMATNAPKSAFTGLEHDLPPGTPPLQQRAAALRLGGQGVPYYPPDKAYKYLGVMLPVTLSTKPHTTYLLDECEARLQLVTSADTYRAHLQGDIESLVLSKVRYSAPLGLISAEGARQLDRLLQGAVKHAAGLPASAANEVVSLPPEALGLGFPSLDMLITCGYWEAATEAMANPGRLGRLARALIRARIHDAGGVLAHMPVGDKQPSLWLRRLARLAQVAPHLLPPEIVGYQTLNPPGTHLHSLTTLGSPAAPLRQQARELVRRMYAVGITSLAPIYNVQAGTFLALPEFQQRWHPGQRATCLDNSFMKLVGWCTTSRRAALQPLLDATAAAHAADPAFTAAAFPARRAAAPQPTPRPSQRPPRPPETVEVPPARTFQTPHLHASRLLPEPASWRVCRVLVDGAGCPTAFLLAQHQATIGHWYALDASLARQVPAVAACIDAHYLALTPPLGHALPPPELAHAQRTTVISSARPVDPETDIGPAAEPRIYTHDGACNVYDAAGSLAGRITPARLQFLWERYQQSAPTIPNAGFLPELVALLYRYQDGRRMGVGGQVQLANHWAVPTPVYDALRELCSTTTELFASPLNCDAHCHAYFTAFKEDAVFGASYDAYSGPWTAGPCVFNPEYDRDALTKSVHWALASQQRAGPDTPFLAVGVLPVYDQYPHTSALRAAAPLFAHTLATVPAHHFNFIPARHAPRGARTDDGHSAGFPVQFVLFSNAAGRAAYFNARALDGFQAALEAHIHHVRGDAPRVSARTTLPQVRPPPERGPPAKLPPALAGAAGRILQRWDSPLARRRPPMPAAEPPPSAALPVGARPPPADEPPVTAGHPGLAHDWSDFVYTDASYTAAAGGRPARRGCGVYTPSAPPPSRRVRFTYSSGAAPRGELLALRWAIERATPASALRPLDPYLHILSDCKGAIDLINRALYTPLEVQHHEHAALLAGVVQAIAARPCPVHISRVRAHVGVCGNL
jgi:hypothetical protein